LWGAEFEFQLGQQLSSMRVLMFHSVHPRKCQDNTSTKPWSHPSISAIIHQSFYRWMVHSLDTASPVS
jgi:hypothetical protein